MHRFTLERYHGPGSRYVCPRCGRKRVFSRYVDTHNNNAHLSPDVGKCSRLDKCGYHYTPRQYFEDHPWLRDKCLFVQSNRVYKQTNKPQPPPKQQTISLLPDTLLLKTQYKESPHTEWLMAHYGRADTLRIMRLYRIGASDDWTIFWQIDRLGRIRTGKCMRYDATTGKRLKEPGSIDWIHALMRREGALPEGWELTQCLYGEHLLAESPDAPVAVVEAYKTAHVGAILMPEYVWVAVDSMSGLTAERLAPLKGRSVILFPDEGRGFEEWTRRIEPIAREVGFKWRVSHFMEGREQGSDIADLV